METDTNLINSQEFEMKLTGEGISPETVRVKDLADILISVEDAIISIILQENSDINENELIIGLVNIERGSAGFKFSSSFPKLALSAYTALSIAIGNKDLTKLPPKAIQSVENISDYSKRRGCVVEFRPDPTSHAPAAKITPDSILELPESLYVSGETTIYGLLERIGGVKPIARLKLSDHEVLSCSVSKDLAKKLGNKLYEWVGLRGKAKWLSIDFSLDSFYADELTPYLDSALTNSFDELAAIAGDFWKDVTDVVAEIRNIRGEPKE